MGKKSKVPGDPVSNLIITSSTASPSASSRIFMSEGPTTEQTTLFGPFGGKNKHFKAGKKGESQNQTRHTFQIHAGPVHFI